MLGETSKPRNAEKRKWQAQSDARTLAEADVIKKDAERLKAATIEAKAMAEEQQKAAKAIGKVAKLSYKTTKKQEQESGSSDGQTSDS